jgi:hypothetical protein
LKALSGTSQSGGVCTFLLLKSFDTPDQSALFLSWLTFGVELSLLAKLFGTYLALGVKQLSELEVMKQPQFEFIPSSTSFFREGQNQISFPRECTSFDQANSKGGGVGN